MDNVSIQISEIDWEIDLIQPKLSTFDDMWYVARIPNFIDIISVVPVPKRLEGRTDGRTDGRTWTLTKAHIGDPETTLSEIPVSESWRNGRLSWN